MALKRMVLQIGMGTDIRGADYTKAAVRALRDALWHNSLSIADAAGLPVDAMQVEVTIGVPRPDRVDKEAVLAVLPTAPERCASSKVAWRYPTTRGRIQRSLPMPLQSCGSISAEGSDTWRQSV